MSEYTKMYEYIQKQTILNDIFVGNRPYECKIQECRVHSRRTKKIIFVVLYG